MSVEEEEEEEEEKALWVGEKVGWEGEGDEGEEECTGKVGGGSTLP
jgi:hypothetical protein